MSNGFTGVGELLGMLPDKRRALSIDENMRLLWPILEVCQATRRRCSSIPGASRTRTPVVCGRSILLDDIAIAFPDLRLIVGHAGVQTGWYTSFPEHALMVAARHPHVYLELSQCHQSQIERAVHDPNIGADRLLFGSDWGASISYHYYGKGTTIYASTPPLEPPTELPLHID